MNKKEKRKYDRLNTIIKFCKTPQTVSDIAEKTKSYEASYIRKIMAILDRFGYVEKDVIPNRNLLVPIYKARVDSLSFEECIDIIDKIMKRHQKYINTREIKPLVENVEEKLKPTVQSTSQSENKNV
jgi:hypothetical protein